MAGRVTITASLNELPQGSAFLGPLTISPNTDNLQADGVYTLAEGPNSVVVPDWSVGVVIIPTSTNTVGLILKGADGDTGIALNPAAPTLISFSASPPDVIVIAAESDFSTTTTFFFF